MAKDKTILPTDAEMLTTLTNNWDEADTNDLTSEDEKMYNVVLNTDVTNEVKIKFLITKLRETERENRDLTRRAGMSQRDMLKMQREKAFA